MRRVTRFKSFQILRKKSVPHLTSPPKAPVSLLITAMMPGWLCDAMASLHLVASLSCLARLSTSPPK